MLRKHLNSLDTKAYNSGNFPFYAWQCITLQLPHRDVDLVIKDDRDMNDFLTLVIRSMETVDGGANSQAVVEKKIKEYKVKQMIVQRKSKFYNLESLQSKAQVSPHEKDSIQRATLFKFKLMRIRSKISFAAFLRNMTIPELFYHQI